MALTRTIPPSTLPISLSELKAHLRYTDTSEDALIMGYLRAAVEDIEGYTGLGLITQTWKQTFSAFSTNMILYRRPLQLIGSPLSSSVVVEYLDSAGALQVLSDTVYQVSMGSDQDFPEIQAAYGQSWPASFSSSEAISVTYTVGFGPDGNSVPELIRLAVMMTAANWFGYREDIVMGTSVSDVLPFASRNMLRNWRPLVWA